MRSYQATTASPYVVGKRRSAAEDVCWAIMLMMSLGGLEIDQEWKDFLAKPMQAWADLAAETGILGEGIPDPVTAVTEGRNSTAE